MTFTPALTASAVYDFNDPEVEVYLLSGGLYAVAPNAIEARGGLTLTDSAALVALLANEGDWDKDAERMLQVLTR